jgi:hypothetical protein
MNGSAARTTPTGNTRNLGPFKISVIACMAAEGTNRAES